VPADLSASDIDPSDPALRAATARGAVYEEAHPPIIGDGDD
jgi:hypothetical protein